MDGVVREGKQYPSYPWPCSKCPGEEEENDSWWMEQSKGGQYHPGPVTDTMEEKDMTPGEWNKQRKASNNQ